MADPTPKSPAPAAPPSPQLAALQFKEKELAEKNQRIASMQSSPGHDMNEVRTRNEAQLKEVRDAIAQLSK